MSTEMIALLLHILFTQPSQDIEIKKSGAEITIKVDGQESKMIQPVIGKGVSTEIPSE